MSDEFPDYEVQRDCPACGRQWVGLMSESPDCECGTVASESYSSDDAREWNEQVDKHDRGRW
jgi:hypothetical protein